MEKFCAKCQGMVNHNGCDLETCPVNGGMGHKAKQEREAKEAKDSGKKG